MWRYLTGLGWTLVVMAIESGPASAEAPPILSPYRDLVMPVGSTRVGPHPAIDFDGKIGDPVLTRLRRALLSSGNVARLEARGAKAVDVIQRQRHLPRAARPRAAPRRFRARRT